MQINIILIQNSLEFSELGDIRLKYYFYRVNPTLKVALLEYNMLYHIIQSKIVIDSHANQICDR